MAINLEIRARNGDSPERLIKRFIKKVKKEKILEECRDRMRYKKPSDVRREAKKRSKRKMKIEQEQNNG
tara:strand:+ start:1105 stop:1311 length:207 start_codon:yes stop_codon:yes gene_type:complete